MLKLNGTNYVISHPVDIDGYTYTLTDSYSLTDEVRRMLAEERQREEAKVEDAETFFRRYMNKLDEDNAMDYRYRICYITGPGTWREVHRFSDLCRQIANKFVTMGNSMWWALMPWGEVYFKYMAADFGGYDVENKYKIFASYEDFLCYLGVTNPEKGK